MFALDIVATAGDMDELEHVSNLVYVRWILEVAQAHSTACGYDQAAYRDLGAIFVVRRHEVDYLRPAFAGDRIRLQTWVESWKGASCVRATRITRLVESRGSDGEPAASEPPAGAEAGEEIEVARGLTVWAFVNLTSGRPTRIPPGIREVFEREERARTS